MSSTAEMFSTFRISLIRKALPQLQCLAQRELERLQRQHARAGLDLMLPEARELAAAVFAANVPTLDPSLGTDLSCRILQARLLDAVEDGLERSLASQAA